MRNNDTGEFELVVGNRQLLSAFFIVVLLFAVAFAMGYVVGQNSPRSAKVQEAAAPAPNSSATDARPQALSAPPPVTPAATPPKPADSGQPQTQPDTQPQPTTQPARDPNAPVQPATPPVTPPAAPPVAADEPPGSYWQVLATSNQDSAKAVLQTLKNKGFKASLSPGPNNWTRVLVGPFADKQALAKAKTDLENAGFSAVRH
jgi:cell division septation protein DedD